MSSAGAGPWSVRYADGSANSYLFVREAAGGAVEVVYSPTTPRDSSSGSYSGGQPARATLAGDDPRIGELWRQVELFASDETLQADARAMGTGAFEVVAAGAARSFVVRACPALNDFDAMARAIIGPQPA